MVPSERVLHITKARNEAGRGGTRRDGHQTVLTVLHFLLQVDSDTEALKLMNDSVYGLTASVWTSPTDPKSIEAFHALADDLESQSASFDLVPLASLTDLSLCDLVSQPVPYSSTVAMLLTLHLRGRESRTQAEAFR